MGNGGGGARQKSPIIVKRDLEYAGCKRGLVCKRRKAVGKRRRVCKRRRIVVVRAGKKKAKKGGNTIGFGCAGDRVRKDPCRIRRSFCQAFCAGGREIVCPWLGANSTRNSSPRMASLTFASPRLSGV